MTRLERDVFEEMDRRLAPVDAALGRAYPGDAGGRQPVHTVYVPADRFTAGTVAEWGSAALAALREYPPFPFPDAVVERVMAKLEREPIEDLRVDFEDGYGIRSDEEEDDAAAAAGAALRAGAPAFFGLRCKSLEAGTRHRAVRTLDVFLDALGPPPPGFVITLPKVSAPGQVSALTVLCGHLENAYQLAPGTLRFEVQIENAAAIMDTGGSATVARIVHAAHGRCVGLHYGTYDYSAGLGIAAAYQSMSHPVADYAKAVMQVAAAGTGVRLSDGSTNVLPVGDAEAVHRAWRLHARLVRRSLTRGYYQGWDLHPAQLPTRFAATYQFFRDGLAAATDRLSAYLDRRSTGTLDEPATAHALADFLRRGRDCGALTSAETELLGSM